MNIWVTLHFLHSYFEINCKHSFDKILKDVTFNIILPYNEPGLYSEMSILGDANKEEVYT